MTKIYRLDGCSPKIVRVATHLEGDTYDAPEPLARELCVLHPNLWSSTPPKKKTFGRKKKNASKAEDGED